MPTIVHSFAGSLWSMLLDSAFLLLLGIFLAGIIRFVLSVKDFQRLLKGGKNTAVFKSALFGVPLPLCSCSVLPVAYQLHHSGLNKGATASFLISTPETGVDSVLLTYSLMDPLMTVARPVSAFLTALLTGFVVNTGHDDETDRPGSSAPACADCGSNSVDQPQHAESLWQRLTDSVRYAFVDLLGDLSPYLVTGYLLAGAAAVILGNDLVALPEALRSGWAGYAGAIVVGLPLYICATSSTPLAAVLLAAGFSPGAIMVFLLVGPATNIAALTVARKILGGAALAKYLVVIILVSVLCGLGVDALYDLSGFSPEYSVGEHSPTGGLISFSSAVVLSAYVSYLALRKLVKRLT